MSISGNDAVAVMATASNTVVTTIPTGANPYGLAVTPNGAFVYVVNNSDATVSVISTATNTVTATIPVGEVGIAPVYVAFAVRTNGPTGMDQCKQGGWQTFTNPSFRNQGECVSFVNHMNQGHH